MNWHNREPSYTHIGYGSTTWLWLRTLAPALHIGSKLAPDRRLDSGWTHRLLPRTLAQAPHGGVGSFENLKFQHILACKATARGQTVKRMAPGDSAGRVGLVGKPVGLSNCSSGLSKVESTPPVGFRIPKFRHILACRGTARGRTVKRMPPWDSECRGLLVRHCQGLSDCSGGLSKVGNTPFAEFRNLKFQHVFASRGTARGRMVKSMAPGDSVH